MLNNEELCPPIPSHLLSNQSQKTVSRSTWYVDEEELEEVAPLAVNAGLSGASHLT